MQCADLAKYASIIWENDEYIKCFVMFIKFYKVEEATILGLLIEQKKQVKDITLDGNCHNFSDTW